MLLHLRRSAWTTTESTHGRKHRITGVGSGWAEIEEQPDGYVLRQDAVRSFPLFYSANGEGDMVVSDDVRVIVDALGSPITDPESALEFRHLGYVAGADTLHNGIRQVQSGEQVVLTRHGQVRSTLAPVVDRPRDEIGVEARADTVFSEGLRESFGRLLDAADGRQLVVPLSGGLDSRLVAVILRDLGYENILAFTYGTGETAESRVSRSVADALGVRWEFVPYDVEAMRLAWAARETASFISDSYAGASLPHIQDWYAIRFLRDRGLIESDAVFLAGHTVVGNMHDDEILQEPDAVSAARIRDLILRHHAVLQPDSLRALGSEPRFLAKIDTHLEAIGYDGSPESRLDALTSWNFRERQTKYINNSMRGYEHFGFDWALPMLAEPVQDAWNQLPMEYRRDRRWYAGYVARRYRAATGAELDTWQPSRLPSTARARLRAALRTTGLLEIANRWASARAYQNHPMGFPAFLPAKDSSAITRVLLRGGAPMGLFADRFLADDWNPHTGLFRTDPAASSTRH